MTIKQTSTTSHPLTVSAGDTNLNGVNFTVTAPPIRNPGGPIRRPGGVFGNSNINLPFAYFDQSALMLNEGAV